MTGEIEKEHKINIRKYEQTRLNKKENIHHRNRRE